jgi:hypothetical protein
VRRAIALTFAAALLVPAAGGSAQPALALEANARASILAGTLDVQPAFDPAIADSRAASSNVGTSSLQSVGWPGFLVDAFFFLYGFQSVERTGLGIAEARWPQGPGDSDATLSSTLLAGVPADDSGRIGTSVAHADRGRAGGVAMIHESALPGISFHSAKSTTSVVTLGRISSSASEQTVQDVEAGPLLVRAVQGRARAIAGAKREATQSLVVTGATVAGNEVAIEESGVHATTEVAQQAVEQALSAAGMTVRLLPGSKRAGAAQSSASSGGLFVGFQAAQTDPTGTPRNVVVGFLLGSASADSRAVALGSAPVVSGGLGGEDVTPPAVVAGRPSLPPASFVNPMAPRILRRTILTRASGPPWSARAAYGGLVLAALGLLLARPLLRISSRP